MHQHGIPAVTALGSPQNTIVSDERYRWSLYPYVDGKHLKPNTFTKEALMPAGDMLARIHVAGAEQKDLQLPTRPPLTLEKFEGESSFIFAHLEAKPQLDAFDIAVRESIVLKQTLAAQFAQPIDLGSFPQTVIHGDYQHLNFFFDDNDQIAWIIDWDLAVRAPRITEVVRSLSIICFDSDFTDERGFQRAEHYLAAYMQRQPFSKNELRAGFHHFLRNTILTNWIPNIHYAGNTRVDQFLPKEVARIRHLSGHLDELVERLYSPLER